MCSVGYHHNFFMATFVLGEGKNTIFMILYYTQNTQRK